MSPLVDRDAGDEDSRQKEYDPELDEVGMDNMVMSPVKGHFKGSPYILTMTF